MKAPNPKYPNTMNPDAVLRDLQESEAKGHFLPGRPKSLIGQWGVDELMARLSALDAKTRKFYLQVYSEESDEGEAAARIARGLVHQEAVPDVRLHGHIIQSTETYETDAGDTGPPRVRAEERGVVVARGEEADGPPVREGEVWAEPDAGDLPESGGELRPDLPDRSEGRSGGEATGPEPDRLDERYELLLGE